MKTLTINEKGKFSINVNGVVETQHITFNQNLKTALLVISNHWSDDTMDGVIGAIILNNIKIHEVPAGVKNYTNTIDLMAYLKEGSNTLAIVFLAFDMGPWTNVATTSLILDGHNAETITYTSEGSNYKEHVLYRNIQK